MSRTRNWVAAWLVGIAGMGLGMGALPTRAAADDIRAAAVKPAVLQSTSDPQNSATVQPAAWRGGVRRGGIGIGVYGGVWGRPRVGVYVGPRVAPRRYYAPRYYGGYYRPYGSYGYGYYYPRYGYYGYSPYGYGYGYTW